MIRNLLSLLATGLILGGSVGTANANSRFFFSEVEPVAAPDGSGTPQTIAGQPGAGTVWDIKRGSVRMFGFGSRHAVVIISVRGLVVPLLEEPFPVDPTAFPFPVPNPATCASFGFPPGVPCFGSNPSPIFLARVVCHDESGTPAVVATTKTAPLSPEGNGSLLDVVALPGSCTAPIVLLGGELPDGSPGRWFGVTGF